jgi:hypothetical protein
MLPYRAVGMEGREEYRKQGDDARRANPYRQNQYAVLNRVALPLNARM